MECVWKSYAPKWGVDCHFGLKFMGYYTHFGAFCAFRMMAGTDFS